MEIDIIKMEILDILTLDDEPLNLIFEEAGKSSGNLKEPYKNIIVSEEEIRNSLKELIINKYVLVLDEKGKEMCEYNIDQVLKNKTPWAIWFRLTESGKKMYDNNYDKFFVE